MERTSKTANIFMIFLLLYYVLFITAVGWVHRSFILGTPWEGWLVSPWFLVFGQVGGLLVPLLIFMAFCEKGFRQTLLYSLPGLKNPLGGANIFYILALVLCLQPAMMLMSGIASLFMENPVTNIFQHLAVIPFPVALAIVALTPAICEEWVFRGFVQSHYADKPTKIAAVINGIFFGLIHMSLHQFTYAFVMGVVFFYMAHYTRNIWAPVLAHFAVNAIQFSLGYLAGLAADLLPEQYYETNPTELGSLLIGLAVVNLFMVPVMVLLFRKFRRHNKEVQLEEISDLG